MRYFQFVAAWCGLSFLLGCSPTFNWRDVHPDQAPLTALFPCKPEQSARRVALAAKDVTMAMLTCDAGHATFTLAMAETNDASSTGAVLRQWKSATLGNMQAVTSSERLFVLKGSSGLPPPVQVLASGTRPDGTALTLQAVWFAAGSQVFQAAVVANAANPAVVETYFAGLRLQ